MQFRTIFIYGLLILVLFLIVVRMWLVNGPDPNQTADQMLNFRPTPLPFGETRVVELQANESWRLVAKGPVRISALGTVDLGGGLWTAPDDKQRSGDADLPLPDLPYGTLIAKVGQNGRPFRVGKFAQIAAKDDVYLAINDSDLSDNSGFYTITLTGGTKY